MYGNITRRSDVITKTHISTINSMKFMVLAVWWNNIFHIFYPSWVAWNQLEIQHLFENGGRFLFLPWVFDHCLDLFWLSRLDILHRIPVFGGHGFKMIEPTKTQGAAGNSPFLSPNFWLEQLLLGSIQDEWSQVPNFETSSKAPKILWSSVIFLGLKNHISSTNAIRIT